jgi:hypothetical protein
MESKHSAPSENSKQLRKKIKQRGIIVSCICVAPHNTSSDKPIKNFQATDMHKPQARDQIIKFSFYQRKKHN